MSTKLKPPENLKETREYITRVLPQYETLFNTFIKFLDEDGAKQLAEEEQAMVEWEEAKETLAFAQKMMKAMQS